MKKYSFLLLLFFLKFQTFFAQSSYNEFWNKLLNNDRESAELLLDKVQSNDINKLITSEILKVERGNFGEDETFIKKFINQKDFEYYLYALWNESYVFDAYLASGFNDKNKNNLKELSKSSFKSTTVKDAIMYLKAIVARENNNWDDYFKYNDSLKVIKEWQYCGVFENLNKSGLDKLYEPEIKSSSKTDFDARSNGRVNWYTSRNKKEAYQFFTNHEEFGVGVNYAQTFISTTKDERVILRIGSGSAFKVWLNDILIYQNPEDVITELNAYKVAVTIPKGVNRLLIKLAESNSSSYFIASVLDEEDNSKSNIEYTPFEKTYNKSSLSEINPVLINNEFETYFINKVNKSPDDFFYTYCLINTYLRNSKFKEAKEVLRPYLKKFPKSSLLRKILMVINNSEGDTVSYNELKKNLELDDPDYYLPIILKVVDYSDLMRMSMNEFEEFLGRLKKNIHNKIIDVTADFIYNARKENLSGVRKNLDELEGLVKNNLKLRIRYAPLFGKLFNEEDKTISLLEDINDNHFDYSAVKLLATYYEKKGEKDKAIKLLSKDLNYLSEDNTYLLKLIRELQAYKKYKESMKYIEMGLKNYPYSFQLLELKGDALVQENKNDLAIEAYEKSLKFNSGNNSLRKKITDLKKEPNILKELDIKDPYTYIDNNRGKITINNYGYNILFDDSNIELYNEGGGKSKFTYIYEITSDSGVESFKEYNLGLSGNYHINKSEVVKANKSIVPAERSGSNLVFNGLSIGDVIYIDYESTFTSTGRFYKDYSDKFILDSYHPTIKSSVKVITPKNHKLYYKVENGNLKPKISKKGNYNLYEWTVENLKNLEQVEDYMPNNVDIAMYLHLSTIADWNDISVWYSDLVRSSIEEDSVVKDAFNQVFPDGYSQFDGETRAKFIYNYIKNNFTYSYVNFKQSGFIPQKPSKTIRTNLGDCKDFSTLFVTLAKMADLEANLVLVLTSDNGMKELVLPSTDFNHCIVKVLLNGKEQFLELTDKYLPFKSLPTSLRRATALEIPFSSDTTTKYDLFKLGNDVIRDPSVFQNKVVAHVNEDNMKISIETQYTGQVNSYYASIISEPNFEVEKKSIYDNLKAQLNEDFVLNDLTNVERIDDDRIIKYTSDITLNKKTNKIGSINIFQLPLVSRPYTSSIINYEKRNYPIEYIQYENLDEYYNSYDLFIDESKTFIEIPKNRKFTFKEHFYEISYELIKNNHLKVIIHSKPSLENIQPEDYEEFKVYVKSILDAEKEFIGYK